MLTKREKILLQFAALFLVFALLLALAFTPSMTSYIQGKAQKESLVQELEEAALVLESPGLKERLAEQKNRMEINYDYFYAVLNSYTIDEIFNRLIQTNNLSVMNLKISPYENADYDFSPPQEDLETGMTEESTQGGQVLVKSTIQLNVEGNYEDILRFIDDLNQTSTCLRVNSMSLTDQDAGISVSAGMSAAIEIYVYGINMQVAPVDMEIVQE